MAISRASKTKIALDKFRALNEQDRFKSLKRNPNESKIAILLQIDTPDKKHVLNNLNNDMHNYLKKDGINESNRFDKIIIINQFQSVIKPKLLKRLNKHFNNFTDQQKYTIY